MPESGRFLARPDVLARRVDHEVVVVDLAGDEVFALNHTGGRLWELVLGEGLTVPSACVHMASEFGVDEAEVRAEADALLASLLAAGLIADAS